LANAEIVNVYDVPSDKFANVYVGPPVTFVYCVRVFVFVVVYDAVPLTFKNTSITGMYDIDDNAVLNVANAFCVLLDPNDGTKFGGFGRPGKTTGDNWLGALLIPWANDVAKNEYADPVTH
jgi:hypothetical protein